MLAAKDSVDSMVYEMETTLKAARLQQQEVYNQLQQQEQTRPKQLAPVQTYRPPAEPVVRGRGLPDQGGSRKREFRPGAESTPQGAGAGGDVRSQLPSFIGGRNEAAGGRGAGE